MALAPPPTPPPPPAPAPVPALAPTSMAGTLAATLAGGVSTAASSMTGVAGAGAGLMPGSPGAGLSADAALNAAALSLGFGATYGEPAAKRFKGSGSAKTTGDPTEEGEVRFRNMESAHHAARLFNGSNFRGHIINVAMDPSSQDASKIIVTNMPPGIAWQELKDHFVQVGEVHYANIGRTAEGAAGSGGAFPGAGGSSKGGYGAAQAGQPCVGEVRYTNSEEATLAVQLFNNQPFKGTPLNVKPDLSSWHGTKVLVFGVPVGTEWTELREHFERAGNIAFCGIDCPGKNKGKGKGGPGFMQPGFDAMQGGVMGQQQFMGQSQQFQSPQAPMMGGPPLVGEVRFGSAELAMNAISQLNGTLIYEHQIRVVQDGGCKDGSRILVFGLTHDTPREALREHFERIGHVEFAGWKGKGKGRISKGFPGAFDASQGLYTGPPAQQSFGAQQQGFQQIGQVVHPPMGAMGQVGQVVQPPGMGLYGGGMAGSGQVDPMAAASALQQQGNQPVGEVRFINALHAGSAITLLNGSNFHGSTISVVQDGSCRDGSRVLVFGIPPETPRQLMQEHFEQAGTVAFCGWKGKGGGGAGFAGGLQGCAGGCATAGGYIGSAAGYPGSAAAGYQVQAQAHAATSGSDASTGQPQLDLEAQIQAAQASLASQLNMAAS